MKGLHGNSNYSWDKTITSNFAVAGSLFEVICSWVFWRGSQTVEIVIWILEAKSGMGKTAVFVLASLQQIQATEKAVKVLVVCHTRELAYQIKHEFDRFAKYFTD
eukprot:2790035-Amphidinium_carterae.1